MSSDTASPSAPFAALMSANKDTAREVSPRGVDEEECAASPAESRQKSLPAEELARLAKHHAGRIARQFMRDISNFTLGYMQYSYRMTVKKCDLEKALERYAAEEIRGLPRYWKEAIAICESDDDEDWSDCDGCDDMEADDHEISEMINEKAELGSSDSESEGDGLLDTSYCFTSATAMADVEEPNHFFQVFPATTVLEGGMPTEQVVLLWDDVISNNFVRPSTNGDLEESFFGLLAKALDAYVASALVRPRSLGGAFERASSPRSH